MHVRRIKKDAKMINGNYQFGNMFGIQNMFGMNNFFGGCFNNFGSIFNSYGSYYDCSGYATTAGYEVGNILMQGIGMAITAGVSQRKQNSVKSLTNDVNELNKQISTELKKLNKQEKDYSTAKAVEESWYTSALSSATATRDEQKAIMDSVTTYNQDKATVDGYAAAKSDLQAKIALETDASKKSQLEAQLTQLENNFITANANVKKYEDAKVKYEEAQTKITNLNKKATARQKEIDTIKEKIAELIQSRNQVKETLDSKKSKKNNVVLNKANGNKYTRNKELDITKVGTEEYKVTKQDIQQLVFQFQNQSDPVEKRKIADAIMKIDAMEFVDVASKSQMQARDLVRKWLAENPA